MKSMTIYMAGPIDDVEEHEAQGWREKVGRIAPAGVLLFDPTAAWRGANQITAAALDHGNRCAILISDGVLVNLGGEGRGFGTIREIEFARGHGKPVAVACGTRPLESLCTHDLHMFESLEEALDKLIATIRERQDTPQAQLAMLLGHLPPPERTDDDD